jgi:hypothetical protein
LERNGCRLGERLPLCRDGPHVPSGAVKLDQGGTDPLDDVLGGCKWSGSSSR